MRFGPFQYRGKFQEFDKLSRKSFLASYIILNTLATLLHLLIYFFFKFNDLLRSYPELLAFQYVLLNLSEQVTQIAPHFPVTSNIQQASHVPALTDIIFDLFVTRYKTNKCEQVFEHKNVTNPQNVI